MKFEVFKVKILDTIVNLAASSPEVFPLHTGALEKWFLSPHVKHDLPFTGLLVFTRTQIWETVIDLVMTTG